jgi:hypothetical protein
MGEAWVTIATFMWRHEAELAKAHLEAADIEAALADEGIVAANPLLANAVGGIKLNVPRAEADRAEQVLAEMSETPEAADNACLSCGKPMGEDESACPACGWSYLEG